MRPAAQTRSAGRARAESRAPTVARSAPRGQAGLRAARCRAARASAGGFGGGARRSIVGGATGAISGLSTSCGARKSMRGKGSAAAGGIGGAASGCICPDAGVAGSIGVGSLVFGASTAGIGSLRPGATGASCGSERCSKARPVAVSAPGPASRPVSGGPGSRRKVTSSTSSIASPRPAPPPCEVPKRMTMVACSSIESSTNRTRAGWGASARHCVRIAELADVITLLFRFRCRLLAYLVRPAGKHRPASTPAKADDPGHGICEVTGADAPGRMAASTGCRKAGRNECQAVWPAISRANRNTGAGGSPDKASLAGDAMRRNAAYLVQRDPRSWR